MILNFKKMNHLNKILLAVLIVFFTACQKDPSAGIQSHERAIESVTLGSNYIQVGPAVVDRTTSTVTVRVLNQPGTTFTDVKPNIITSYKSTISPASGISVNFTASNNQTTYTVKSETGETRTWTVILQPFTESILGTYKIQDFTVYGGTGPQYGGGSVFDLALKGTWPVNGNPSVEYDNVLTFAYTGVTSDGNTQGTVVNTAGPNGFYANYIFSSNPVTDVNYNFRVLPKGNGTWVHNYTTNVITLTFADGTVKTCTYASAGTISLGNGLSKTIANNAFVFSLSGADDYNSIYSDYDKIVKRPYTLWVDVLKQ
jgi:hypothetical protein